MVWFQNRLPGTCYVPFAFGVVLFAKVCFLSVWQNCQFKFYTGFIYIIIAHEPNFKLQYLVNYRAL